MKSELFYRVVSAVLFIPAILIIAIVGRGYYLLLIELGIGIGAYEFYKILEKRGLKPYISLGVISALILGWNSYFASHLFTLVTLTVLLFAISISELYRKNIDNAIYHVSVTLFGVLYVGWLLSHLILLRQLPVFLNQADYGRGAIYTIIPFILAWLNDTGAYFIGNKFGNHQVFRRVSPAKTWEGCIGGGICGIIGIFILKFGWAPWMSIIDCIVLGVLGAFAAPFGDLIESLFKRDVQIKDVAKTIPGHGGILDRFDSTLFVAPVVYYYLRFFVV